MTLEEKIIILGALFHDIGKFEQRCTNERTKHEQLGYRFLTNLESDFTNILGNEDAFNSFRNIVSNHHSQNSKNEFVNIIREADHLSASERVDFDKEDDYKDKWSHKYLTSLFSKIYLNDSDTSSRENKYYNQKLLNKNNYKIIIPEYETEKDIKDANVGFSPDTFNDFTNELKTVLSFYKSKEDFNTLISLILILFEKYMWCIPDFKGSEHTDISLYNHLKDVACLSHAILKSNEEKTNLNLIIGDIPSIQKYIFNVTNVKPAKILRGRSIYVQVLTRQFASIILNKLGLTEASLIMLAGGKFYIIAQAYNDFEKLFEEAQRDIEQILIENFNYQLTFSSVAHLFDYDKLKKKEITFGDIIDRASYQLLLKRNQQFENNLFEKDDFDQNHFVLSSNYIEPDSDNNSNSIKCTVTDLPICKIEGNPKFIDIEDGEKLRVDKQVYNEYKLGNEITKDNVIIELSENFNEVLKIDPINNYRLKKEDSNRILINPNIDDLLKNKNYSNDILRNALFIEVANYTTKNEDNPNVVMDFGDMKDHNNGAKIMTLIKGDVDNLGLIMSSGLIGNKEDESTSDEPKDLTGISRTTTLSNHLKYFFSFSLNGFLEDWEKGKILTDEEKEKFSESERIPDNESDEFLEYIKDRKVYTVFAGGDDLMLVCPQSSSLKLLSALNKTFIKFVCENPEVHISYSLTNFKHNTPIRIVADMAEENQKNVKSYFKAKDLSQKTDNVPKIFHPAQDKSGTRLFNTNLKSEEIIKIISYKDKLISWVLNKENKVSHGIIRFLLYIAKILKDFNENNDLRFLIWHPKLTYMINRLLKNKDGEYINKEVETFFDDALKINKIIKDENKKLKDLRRILYPLICEVIYATRNSKGE